MIKLYMSVAAAFGLLAVVLGAFAAHGLKGRLAADSLAAFQTGVQYQMTHALAILLVALIYKHWPGPALLWACGLFIAGVVLFSGSIYGLTLTGARWLGPVTPLGGLCLIAGWGMLFYGVLRSGAGQG